MAISTYAELQTAIANWLDRSDLTDKIPDFITLAEIRIQRNLRVRGMEERSTTTLVPGQEYYGLPDDFLEVRDVQVNTDPITSLKYMTPKEMDETYPNQSNGTPKAFTIIGNEIQLKPTPDSADTFEIAYFEKIQNLSDTNTTNWLTQNAVDLLLYGALIEAEAYLVNDTRIPVWKAAFDMAIQEANNQANKGRWPQGPIAARV